MECDYQEGECSICGKKVKSKAEYCLHLKKYKGGEFNSQPVYEILHGITFTGLGLLDKKGADENARIKTISELNQTQGGKQMPEEKDKQELEKVKKTQVEEKDKDALIKRLQDENQQLKQQVADLQKQIEKYEAEARAAARKAKAEKLLNKLAQKGMSFNDQEREAELKRLSELSDDAFVASEATYDRMPNMQKKEPESEGDKEKKESAKAKADSSEKKLRTDAGVTPLVVDDKKTTLEDKLKLGFMSAYKEQVGLPA